MDRQAWIAVTLCVAGLIGWQYYITKHYPAAARPRTVSASPTPTPATPAATVSATETPALSGAPAAPIADAGGFPSFVEKTATLSNADFELLLTNRAGGISEVILANHAAEQDARVKINAPNQVPIGAILDVPAKAALAEFTMTKQADGSVQFERTSPEHVTISKKFSLPATTEKKDNFLAHMEVSFRNDGTVAYVNPGYFVALGTATPIHINDLISYTRLNWCVEGKAKTIDASWFAAQNYPFVGVEKRPAQPYYTEKVNSAEWAGVSSQFFATLITPLNAKINEVWAHRFELPHSAETKTTYGIEGAMGMPGFQLKPGETSTVQFQIYSGPKLYGRLAKLEHDEAEVMNFGMFKLVSQFLLNLMNSLHRVVGNYAIAILILTALIKAILWPLQNKANRSMRQMSSLSPKMQELKEKYKDDPTRMNQEVMKLYKEYGVNPVSGCVPMMIQIPIFFGLLSMLGQAVELRNAKFLWVHDLSQPDTIAHIPGLGFPINILPLCMGLTNVWLMRMTPKTGDTTQQRVMMFMPLIFLFFCYNFAAALALYYTTQNLFTILQLYQNRRQPVPALEKLRPPGKKRGK